MSARDVDHQWIGRFLAFTLCFAVLSVAAASCHPSERFLVDAAVYMNFDNRLDETVAITYHYEDEREFRRGATVGPKSVISAPVMTLSTGVYFVGTTESGTIVLDRHYRWDQVPPGPSLTIVIER